MLIAVKRILMAVMLSPAICGGAVLYFEGFESPVIADGGYTEFETGPVTFDNSGWEVVNPGSGVGVFIDNNFLFTPNGQVLGFGGGQSPNGNSLYTVISGFAGKSSPTISYEFFRVGPAPDPGQGVRVTVTDPNNGDAVLYTQDSYGNLQRTNDPIAQPSGDTVKLTISQIGDTDSSDSAIDSIEISAVPEPATLALFGLGMAATVIRRRQRAR